MSQDPMQTDTLSRQKITQNIASNFFVEAGAGSGKTTILVKRMVAMIESGIDVGKICAITFTKAAAGEFYERFQKKLDERSKAKTADDADLQEPTDETRNRCRAALNDIDLCFMGTIDAFCNMVLSEHPIKAGIPSGSCVLSAEEIAVAYKKEYSEIQRGHYGDDLKALCNRFRAFHKKPNDVFISAIGTMMDTRNCKRSYTIAPDKTVDNIFKDDKAAILSLFRALLNNAHLAYDKNADSKKAWETLKTKELLLFSPWQNNFSGVLTALKEIAKLRLIPEADISRLAPNAQQYIEPHEKSGKILWFQFDEAVMTCLMQKLLDLQYAVTMEFLDKAALAISDTMRLNGQLTYFDYLLYLRDLLKKDAVEGGKLIAHIYDRHSYFLIDEFQDTNPMQAEIFFYLTAKKPTPDWRACVPRAGSLFIVGDPKQSIYRFRYADVTSFLKVKALFCGEVGEVLYLTRNFRSTYKLRNWFNSTFKVLLPDNTDIQSRFEPIPLETAPQKDDTFSGVYSYNITASSVRSAAPSEKDPETVARIVRRMVENPAYKICENGKTRTVSYRDIMLITPRKTHLASYMQAFAAHGIPFRVEGSVSFDECPALTLISKLFSIAANPTDSAALIGALTSARYKISLNEIHALKKQGYEFHLFAENNEKIKPSAALSDAMQSLKKLAGRARHLSASALFMAILDSFRLFCHVSADNLPYIYFALELIRAAESAGTFATLSQAASFLDGLIQNKSDAERSISLTRNENRVHIANLHKVKGLEAPIVILADPADVQKKPTIRVTHKDADPGCHIFEVPGTYGSLFSYSGFKAEKAEEQACLDAEKNRLLYVAATRARRVLLVANEIKSDGSASDKNLWKFFVDRAEGDFFTLLPVGKEKPAAAKQTKSADALYQSGEAENLLNTTKSYEESYEIRRPSQIKLKGKSASEDNFEDETSPQTRTNTVRHDAAIVGTMVHSLMEALISSRLQIDVPTLIKEITSEYEAEGDTYQTLLAGVAKTMLDAGYDQKTNVPKDIVKTLLSADEVYCELPFCRNITENGQTVLWHGIMDVVYRTGDVWQILDYKTNADAEGLDEKYEEQLSAYCDAFLALTGNMAQAMIYHIDV